VDRSSRTNPRLTTRIEDLSAALRASAEGLCAAEAAVELLIGHQRWLDRCDFVEGFVESGEGLLSGEPMAWVDWRAAVAALDAGRLGCGDSEAQVLRVAASIADGVPVDLRGAVSGLDEVNATLVAAAVVHAGGRRDAAVALTRAGMAGW
jgi:hypothetical protein